MQIVIGKNDKTDKPLMYDVNNWPPVAKLRLYNERHEIVKTFTSRSGDLTDGIMVFYNNMSRDLASLKIGFTIGSKRWEEWNDFTLTAVEQFLIHDFAHDALDLDFDRVSGLGNPCSTEALWTMHIS